MNQRSFTNLPKSIALAMALAVLAFAAGCSKNANTGNSTNTSNTANKTSTTTTSTTTTSSGLSPKDTIKAYYDAAAKKDIATAKTYLSKGTLSMMEEGAKKMGKSLDEAMKEGANAPVVTPEFGAEAITGDTATVEIKGPAGELVKMPMVKEGGQWKLAIDKMLGDMMKDASPAAPSKSGSADDDEDEHGSGNH
jgi:hypothetical protein